MLGTRRLAGPWISLLYQPLRLSDPRFRLVFDDEIGKGPKLAAGRRHLDGILPPQRQPSWSSSLRSLAPAELDNASVPDDYRNTSNPLGNGPAYFPVVTICSTIFSA
jgi:hypothetical protein